MAKKILKTRTQFTSTLKTELYEALQRYSSETDVPITKLLDKCVECYLKDYLSHLSKEKSPSRE